jgi:Raf kinase inhibitor-like YbhB/YbcL family protein
VCSYVQPELPAIQFGSSREDVDAPGGTFVHWVLWGLDPTKGGLESDASGGSPGVNDFDDKGYGGPYPPPGHGYHHYHFGLYALSKHIDLSVGSANNDLRRAIDGKVLDMAETVGVYAR